MNGGHDERGKRGFDEFAALLGHFEALAEERLRRRRTETHQRMCTDERALGLEPWPARTDFRGIRLGVYPPLTARLPFEVLHDVGHVNGFAIDAGLLQRAIEQLPCWSDKRMTGEILCIPRLLTDKHEAGASWPFAENRLRAA